MNIIRDNWHCFEEQHKWMQELREGKTIEEIKERREKDQRNDFFMNNKKEPVEVIVIQ